MTTCHTLCPMTCEGMSYSGVPQSPMAGELVNARCVSAQSSHNVPAVSVTGRSSLLSIGIPLLSSRARDCVCYVTRHCDLWQHCGMSPPIPPFFPNSVALKKKPINHILWIALMVMFLFFIPLHMHTCYTKVQRNPSVCPWSLVHGLRPLTASRAGGDTPLIVCLLRCKWRNLLRFLLSLRSLQALRW